MTDYLLRCIGCGEEFFAEGERDFYNSKGLNIPKRCKACRYKKKAWYDQIQKDWTKQEEQKELQALLSTLPFKQIKKTDMVFVDPNTVLFIIGNGFDLMHGVPSSYYDFRDSMGRHNELRNALEMYIRKEDLWADFEESLANLDDEAMLDTVDDWMDAFDVKDEYDDDFSAADFFMAAETATAPALTIIRELPRKFKKWVCTLKPTIFGKLLGDILTEQYIYINFNYTEFLETIYGIPKRKVWYIHGDRREKGELILGHASGAEFEVDVNSPGGISKQPRIKNQTAYDLYETAAYNLGGYYNATTKKSDDVIKTNKDRFKILSGVEHVVLIGHSLSQVDYPYFKEIINQNQNAANMKWYISWFSARDLKQIDAFANAMGIQSNHIELFRV